MSHAPAVRAVRAAAIDVLKEEVGSVNRRVYTPPIPATAALPYLVVGSYSESPADHYGHGGSDNGFDIRGVAKLAPGEGDAALLAIYEEVYRALHGVDLDVEGHGSGIVDIRFLRDYAEPSDHTIRHFVARASVTTWVERSPS